MPSFSNSNGTKFQLPALDLKFGSLTEGTDIPPPLPSPIQEEPSELSKPGDGLAKSSATNNGTQTTPEVHRNGLKRSADQAIAPGSPVSTKGPASIRRLFSRYRLNEAAYANNGHDIGDTASMFPRPVSQSNASIATDGQPKRTSGWFRRLRGSDGVESRRSSRIFVSSDENRRPLAPIAPKASGPPPPKLPEFKSLGSKVDLGDDGGSLGADLFKDIK